MRKSDSIFNEPQRQSHFAIALIIYDRIRGLISRIWPLLLVSFISGNFSLSQPDRYTLIFLALTLLTGITGIISYFRYYFWIEDGQLMIKKGILSKSLTTIPFDRIQSIDFEQNVIHQVLGVVGLKIETAGSTGSETKMSALDMGIAKELRNFILSQKSASPELSEENIPIETANDYNVIYKIPFGKLIKIGLTENHLRSFAIILFFLYWIIENIEEAGWNVEQYGNAMYQSVLKNLINIGILCCLFFFISIFVSMARIFLQHFDLTLLRSQNGFKLIQGLFNKKEIAAPDSKVQLIEWRKNVLQKMLHFHTITLKQASSVEVSSQKSIQIPGVSKTGIEKIKDFLFPLRSAETLEFYPVHKQLFYRPVFIVLILMLVLISGFAVYLYYQTEGPFSISDVAMLFPLFTVFVFFCYTRYLRHKKCKYGINDRMIVQKGGVFGQAEWLIMIHKIQSLSIKQSPFMRRKKIANLVINTASGSKIIPYLEMDRAEYLYDYITYRIETTNLEWM